MQILNLEDKIKAEIALVNKAIERGDIISQAAHAYAVYLLNTLKTEETIEREIVRVDMAGAV